MRTLKAHTCRAGGASGAGVRPRAAARDSGASARAPCSASRAHCSLRAATSTLAACEWSTHLHLARLLPLQTQPAGSTRRIGKRQITSLRPRGEPQDRTTVVQEQWTGFVALVKQSNLHNRGVSPVGAAAARQQRRRPMPQRLLRGLARPPPPPHPRRHPRRRPTGCPRPLPPAGPLRSARPAPAAAPLKH